MAAILSTRASSEVGRVIRSRRETLGVSKSAAARRARVSLTTWRLVEAGRAENPTDLTITRMARAVLLDPEAVMRVAGREWDEAAHRLEAERFAPVADAPDAVPDDPLARGYEQRLIDAVEENPLLDARAKRHLIETYHLLVQRGTT